MKDIRFACVFAAAAAILPAQAQFPGARAQQAPVVAPQDIPYTNNVVVNPSFEKGLSDDPAKGWAEKVRNNGEAKCAMVPQTASFKPFDGKKALQLKVKSPVKFPPKFLNGPDYGAFIASANNGKGDTVVGVSQKIEVKPGAFYALRFRWRAEGLRKTTVDPGPERGFSQIEFMGGWLPPKGKKMETAQPIRIKPIDTDSAEWKTFAMPDLVAAAAVAAKTKKMPKVGFLQAPKDAGFLTISISLHCCTPNIKPEAWIDQFELAEINPEELQASLMSALSDPAAAAAAAAAAAKAR